MATSLSLMLPVAGGRLERYVVRGGVPFTTHPRTLPFTRIAYSAAHVVADGGERIGDDVRRRVGDPRERPLRARPSASGAAERSV